MRKLLHVFYSLNNVKRVGILSNLYRFGFVLFLVGVTTKSFGQTFPPATSCTSKDLVLVSATLTPVPLPCTNCTIGTSANLTLTVGINNKTGSTRTSFAFWATLRALKSDGTEDLNYPLKGAISGCFGTIKSSSTSYFTGPYTTVQGSVSSIPLPCGETLQLINIWEAWTTSNANETCAFLNANTSTVNPKCGTQALLNIVSGLDATFTTGSANCSGAGGSITVTPQGGTPPYQVVLLNAAGTSTIATATNINASTTPPYTYTFSGLAAATYTMKIYDAVSTPANCPNPVTKNPTVSSTGVSSAPTVTTPVVYCQNATASPLSATGTNLLWYSSQTGGTGSSTAPTPSTTSAGSTSYWVSQTTTGLCESPRAEIVVSINSLPSAPSAGNVTVCYDGQAHTGSATAGTGETIVWYTTSTGNIVTTAPTGTAVGAYTAYAAAKNSNNCQSATRTLVTVTINSLPSAPTAGNVTVCYDGQAHTGTATAGTGETIVWYTASTNGSITTAPTGTTVGTYTAYAAAKNSNNCESARTLVTVTINALPSAPTAGNVTVCYDGQAHTGTATAGTGETIVWYTASTNGSVTTAPSGAAAGTYTAYAAAKNSNNCESATRTPVTVTINALPSAPSVTTPVVYCQNATASALSATGTNLLWYTSSSGVSGSSTAPTPSTSTAGNTSYWVTQTVTSNGLACESQKAEIVVTVNSVPSAPAICIIQPSLCGPATGSIKVTSPLVSGYQYSKDNGATWQDCNVFLGIAAGSNPVVIYKTGAGCASSSATCSDATICSSTPVNCQTGSFSRTTSHEVKSQTNTVTQTSLKSSAIYPDIRDIIEKPTSVKAYPNPFSDKVKFEVTSAVSGNGSLEIVNILGQKIKTVYQGFIAKGSQTFELSLPSMQNSSFVYVLRIGNKKMTGKLLQINQ